MISVLFYWLKLGKDRGLDGELATKSRGVRLTTGGTQAICQGGAEEASPETKDPWKSIVRVVYVIYAVYHHQKSQYTYYRNFTAPHACCKTWG